MNVPIRRVSKDIPLPEYKTPGAVALDCPIHEDITIPARMIGYALLNFSLQPPAGYFVMLAPRSSLHKRGLMFANSVGIFDEDYSGDSDEYKVILYNFTDESVEIKKGERVAQILFIPYQRIEWEEKDTLGNPERGGIGSTGL